MATRYFLAFPASDALVTAGERLLDQHAKQSKDSLVPNIDSLLDVFIPSFMRAIMSDVGDAVQLGPKASKVIHSASSTISKTLGFMLGKMIKKRSNDELADFMAFIQDIYLRADQNSSGVASVGCEITEELYTTMHRLMVIMKDGRLEEIRDEQAQVMLQIVDSYVNNMMKRMIGTIPVNFVVKKICDGGIVTSRGAGHMVVNKVFKGMDEASMERLSDYFEAMMVTTD